MNASANQFNPRGAVGLSGSQTTGARMTPKEVAQRLSIGTRAVYAMLEQGILPGIRIGQRWLITRHAYEEWERTCGMPPSALGAGLISKPEVTVLN
jgi:excisionase family DNA binding protein